MIIPITQAKLGQTVIRDRFGWQGGKPGIWRIDAPRPNRFSAKRSAIHRLLSIY